MVQLDWKRLLSLSPEDLSEEEKDDLYASLIWYTPEGNIDAERLKVLFRVTQDVLKYKGEQVESLVVELDDLAVRQGEEEARRSQNLIEEIEELRAQLSLSKRNESLVSGEGSEIEELRQELVKCELHNEELLKELKEREKDILAEKREAEKFAGQVAQLEREKAELQRELIALQNEGSEQHSTTQRSDSPEKQQEMAEMIRQKNKHISQLLNDVETIEKENTMLREKLSNLRDELSEATKHITEMTGELTGFKHTCHEQEEKLQVLEEQNVALRSQVQELVEQKLRRDSQLDDFSEALDSRVEEWKRVLEEKNAEIEELQARLSHLAAQAPNIQIDTERSRVALLTQTLQKREDQIEDLQKQLAQATVEMNESAALIEQLKSQTSKHILPSGLDPSTVAKLKNQLQQAEQKVQLLEGKLKDAEEDAQVKAQDATEMIIQLREYESGEYGLAEAVGEIKELRQQRRVRDKQIEDLVQASNNLQAEAAQLEEQNLALKEQLGMPPGSPVRVDGILAQRKKEQLLMKVLQQQAERLEEEKLQLKLENHNLSQQLSKILTHDSVDSSSKPLSHTVSIDQSSVKPLSRTASLDQPVIKKLSRTVSLDQSSFKQHSRALSLDQPNIRQLSHTLSFDQPSIKQLSHTLSFDQSSIKQLSRSVSLDQPEEGSQDEEKIDEMILQRLDQNEDVMAKEMRILKLDQAVVQLEDRLRDLTTENEALRQGMHEILDSIHNQDGSSAVQVESQSLERLLQALDVRHISGWYHPAMRLQAQLQSVEGSNTVLREQLRLTRQEESKSTQELQKALLRIEQLEQNVNIQGPIKAVLSENLKLPPDLPLSSAEIISKLNMHLLHVLDEYEKMQDKNKNLEKKLEELNTNFNMMRHQMGLLYKQHSDEKAEWKTLQTNFDTEKEKLTTKADTLEAKVKEYEKHLAVLNQGEEEQKRLIAESAQNIALASANKVVLERKCKSLQNLENQLRKENNKLKDDMASIECMVTQRIGELQRHKEMSTFKISALQNMLQDSVPLTVMEAANKQYSELTTKYRDLLQKEQTLVCESRLAARLEGELAVLQKDKEELQNALQQAREKVHSLEVLIEAVNKDMVTQDTHDNQISLLSKKLATIELKELGERQRADHADKMYHILKGQLTQLEERNAELETQNSTLVQQNLDLQQLERDLRDNLLTFVSRDELQEVQDKLRKCEQEKIELKLEKDRLKEISDIAQEQIRNLELWKLSQEYQLDYMRRQILELQSTSDERSVIAKLNHELLSSRLSESASHKKVQQLQNEISKLRSHNLRQEVQLDEKEQVLSHLKTQLISRSRSLHQVIQDLRRQYSGSVPLSTHERLVLSLRRLSDERRDATERMHAAEKLAHEAVTAKEEVVLQLNSLQELKTAIDCQEHKLLIEWHNKNTELRLKELKSRRQAEILQSQLQQAEERLHRLEDHIATLEQQQISTERNWEQAQLSWEQMQSELYKQLAEYEMTVGVGKSQPLPKPQATDDQSDNPAVEQLKQALSLISTQSQNLLKYEGELAQLRSKVNSLTQLVEEKDMLLQTKEKALTEMQMQLISSRISPDTGEHPLEMLKIEDDSMEKLALKATIDSLQNIVNQKEETIGRYQQLLKEGRDEHSQAAARFQEELRNLNTTLNALQQAHSKLKSKLRHPSPNRKPIQNMVDQYIFQIQGLEDEVAELHTRLGNLSNQLQSSRQEADRWRNLAEERLNNMGELRKRLEEQHNLELVNYKEESQRYRLDAESAKQDLALVQEELKKQVEAAQRGPSAVMQNCISMLRSQLKDKEAQEQLLQQTIADLQKEMQQLMETPSRDIDDQPALPNRMLQTEVSNLKKQVKMAKDEANRLREQLSNRLKASSKREASLERNSENLHKKIRDLEDQLKQDKEKFENESRRVKSAEEVARWDERKKWQQTVEKLKQKLKEKSNEMERLQASVNSLRDTIARLEREKFVLDNRLRASKSAATSETKLETLELEKSKLENEVSTLRNKLEMQQHHSGGLGTVMLQERLEAQQRRIAVLELAKKGNSAVSDELEKLKEINATLQKANLHLEAENLEFRLELEKYRADTPRLREQVQHLEAYVSLLKSETSSQKEDESEHKSKKSPAELEKTIVALKRVVEKLQNDKKKLKEEQKKVVKELSLQSVGEDVQAELRAVRSENKELQDQQQHSLQRIISLEEELQTKQGQLLHKARLLDQVKTLLQRAAAKEKALHEKVSELQRRHSHDHDK